MAFLTSCATNPTEDVIKAAVNKAIADQAEQHRQETARARDLIRSASKPLPAECGRRVQADIKDEDRIDGWRTAAKYERALVRANDRSQSCKRLSDRNHERVIAIAKEMAAPSTENTSGKLQ
jgi:hypothetical protein